jgi:hypothetical protein
MLSRLHLSVLILLAAGIWARMLTFDGIAVNESWFRPFSTVVAVLLLLLSIFDRWAWRLRVLRGWFVSRPDIRGTWHIELRSDWKDPDTDDVIAPFSAHLVIRQTYSTLSLRLLTSESSSKVIASEIGKEADGTYRLAAVYRNEPRLSLRARSPIHYGAIMLDIQGDPVKNLVGCYWTDRKTRGELRSLSRHMTFASSFAEAYSLDG